MYRFLCICPNERAYEQECSFWFFALSDPQVVAACGASGVFKPTGRRTNDSPQNRFGQMSILGCLVIGSIGGQKVRASAIAHPEKNGRLGATSG
jgi:hypothetical protein